MDPEHLEIARHGKDSIAAWRLENPETPFDLRGADLQKTALGWANLSRANLSKADLCNADLGAADLSFVDLSYANLQTADLSFADVRDAKLHCADLRRADLRKANFCSSSLWGANFRGADLREANLRGANLRCSVFAGANLRAADLGEVDFYDADLRETDLSDANLIGANLNEANLDGAILCRATLTNANLRNVGLIGADLAQANLHHTNCTGARFGSTRLTGVDLLEIEGLHLARHLRPSSLGLDTIIQSKGVIPIEFLRGCGVPSWLIEQMPFFRDDLTPHEAEDLFTTKVFMSRFSATNSLTGVFISYARENDALAMDLRAAFINSGVSCWLDKHDATAGPLGAMITNAIRSRDMLLLILSEHSLTSDWVWHEYQTARRKEQDENRHILCPIALDDAWCNPEKHGVAVQKAVERHGPELDHLKTYNVIPFGDGYSFDEQFDKVIRGMLKFYGPKAE